MKKHPMTKRKFRVSSFKFQVPRVPVRHWVFRHWVFPNVVFVAMLLALASVGFGATQPDLEAYVQSVIAQPRSYAPVLLQVKLTSRTSKLLEGRLHVLVFDYSNVIADCTSGEIPLTTGAQTFRMWLPPVARPVEADQAEAELTFITKERRYDLGRHVLFMPRVTKRSFVIGVCRGETIWTPADTGLVRNLFLEAHDPRAVAPQDRDLSTFAPILTPEDMPAQPLGYCAFDIVALGGSALEALKAEQLTALVRWVQAGGSVCILPTAGLSKGRLDFLNALADGETRNGLPPFELDEAGALSITDKAWLPSPYMDLGIPGVQDDESDAGKGGVIWRSPCGLGRAIVVLKRPESTMSRQWLEAVAFLWKMRTDQLGTFLREGNWRVPPANARSGGAVPGGGVPGGGQWVEQEPFGGLFRPYNFPTQTAIYEGLVPKSIKVMPMATIVLILILFALAIGPGDYCLLGLLRRRKLTWLLFPLTSIAFTVFVVMLSRHYMGTADRRSSLTLVDVGKGGKVLRWSRYEMFFPGRNRLLSTDVQNGFYLPLEVGLMGGAQYDQPGRREAHPTYEGWIPARFAATAPVYQWTPAMSRTFSMEPFQTGVDLNWDALDRRSPGSVSSADIEKTLNQGRQFDGYVLLLKSPGKGERPGMGGTLYAPGRAVPGDLYGINVFLSEVSAPPPLGAFQVVSQLSPTGGSALEDLSVLDPGDASQWLVVAVKRVGNNFIVCRRLYHGGE